MADLTITEGSTILTIACRDSIVLVVRKGSTSELCTAWADPGLRAMNVTGLKAGDMLVASLVEDVTISPLIIKDLAKLPAEVRASERLSGNKKKIFDATAEGHLARTIVIRIEQDYEAAGK